MWLGPFLFSTVVSAALVAWAGIGSRKVLPQSRKEHFQRWFLIWTFKGLLVPMALWAVMNFGISFSLQPFLPAVQAARNAGRGWGSVYMEVLTAGFFMAASFWSAATLAWALVEADRELDAESRKKFRGLCGSWLIVLALPALALAWFGGLGTLGLAVFFIATIIVQSATSILEAKRHPMYSRAVAHMKFGKYAEAEWEIIRELEKCEDDFDGWMMMAELYATHFRDVPEAQKTIAEICEHPKTTAPQFSIALNRLADWHLKIAHDPEGASRALQVICDRLPGTHLARMAQLRIRQLPQTQEQLREQNTASPIPMPALGDMFEGEPPQSLTAQELARAAETANGYVKRLEINPDDTSVRERLARVMAERLNQAGNGIEQLTLLLEMPEQPEARRAEWLSLIAAWQLKYLEDRATGRHTLERLIEEYPRSPQAVAARRRIQLMDRQLNAS